MDDARVHLALATENPLTHPNVASEKIRSKPIHEWPRGKFAVGLRGHHLEYRSM